jgi:hypothetical protein
MVLIMQLRLEITLDIDEDQLKIKKLLLSQITSSIYVLQQSEVIDQDRLLASIIFSNLALQKHIEKKFQRILM